LELLGFYATESSSEKEKLSSTQGRQNSS